MESQSKVESEGDECDAKSLSESRAAGTRQQERVAIEKKQEEIQVD